jgi:hypothetical protein
LVVIRIDFGGFGRGTRRAGDAGFGGIEHAVVAATKMAEWRKFALGGWKAV